MSVILDCLFSYLFFEETRIYKEVLLSISLLMWKKLSFSVHAFTVVCVRDVRTDMHLKQNKKKKRWRAWWCLDFGKINTNCIFDPKEAGFVSETLSFYLYANCSFVSEVLSYSSNFFLDQPHLRPQKKPPTHPLFLECHRKPAQRNEGAHRCHGC